jgi:site-specific DNA-methyltransferase (adenine-specific)
LQGLPSGVANCCITSPPYWNLRDYGVDGQLGREQDVDEYAENMAKVSEEIRRVLRDDGTMWVNIGDTYCNGMISAAPWRLALTLERWGWLLIQDIIWHKPNAKPENVTRRCTHAHEYLFLFAKSAAYYFDREAMREPAVYAGVKRGGSKKRYQGQACGMDSKVYDTRNRRTVWSVQTEPYKHGHQAAYPESLIEPCVLASCPVGGLVIDPFTGSGTTGVVALKHGRRFIGAELNPEWAETSRARMEAIK